MILFSVFIICHSPKFIPNIFEIHKVDQMMTSDYPLWIDYLRVFSHLLAVLNATSDSLIYFWRHSDVIIQEMDIAGLMEVQVN